MIAGGVTLAVAPSATAGVPLSGCQALSQWAPTTWYWIGAGPYEDYAAGERVTVSAGDPSRGSLTTITLIVNNVVVDTTSYGGSLTYTFPTAKNASVGWRSDGGGDATWTVTCGSVSVVSASPIPAWVQGYGRKSAADICDDGWKPSWEMWPNRGTGGWDCSREIPSLG
jgi:hypothetical protein